MSTGSFSHFSPSPEGLAEYTVIQQASQGNHDAFRRLVSIYESKLLTYLFRMVGDHEVARDLAQETFLIIYQSLARWKPTLRDQARPDQETLDEPPLAVPEIYPKSPNPLAPWLYRIATNRAVSYLRKRKVRARHHVPLTLQAQQEEGLNGDWTNAYRPQDQPDIEERLVSRDMLQTALKQLPEKDAICIVLHFVLGERYDEIATRVQMTEAAVRKRVYRAMQVLKKLYLTLLQEESKV